MGLVGTLGQLESVTPELSLCPGSYHPLVVTLAPSDSVICPAPPGRVTQPSGNTWEGRRCLSYSFQVPIPLGLQRGSTIPWFHLRPQSAGVPFASLVASHCSLYSVVFLLKMAVHLAIVQGPGLVQRMCLTHTSHLESVLPLLRGRDLWI